MATWQALESNPETINPFLAKMGISGVECVDVFSFEDEFLGFVPTPQYALLLCFPSDEAKDYLATVYEEMKAQGKSSSSAKDDVFFMKQKIRNACGTFALFHSIANLEGTIDIGTGPFRNWLDNAKSVGEEDRSDLLANDSVLAAAHEETAASGETEQPEADKVEYHFICYVNRNGHLYEIDSCAPFPRCLGATTPETVVKDAGKAVAELIKRIDNLSFAAMALVGKQ